MTQRILVVDDEPDITALVAYHLAKAGLDVLLLEKKHYPREKTCGDGLTPRSVKQLYDILFTVDGGQLGFGPAIASIAVCLAVCGTVVYGGVMLGKAVFALHPHQDRFVADAREVVPVDESPETSDERAELQALDHLLPRAERRGGVGQSAHERHAHVRHRRG